MARIRSIRPEFWSDEVIVKLDFFTRLLYIAMWNFADDSGRNRCISKEIVGFAFPLDDDIEKSHVEKGITQLAKLGRIVLYDVNNIRHYQIVNWGKHQVVNRPTASRIPSPHDYKPAKESGTCNEIPLSESLTESLTESSSIGIRNQEVVIQESVIRNQEVGNNNRASAPPPTLEEVKSWFNDWRGRPEVGEIYWHWFDELETGWPKVKDQKALAFRKAPEWCARQDRIIQERAFPVSRGSPARNGNIKPTIHQTIATVQNDLKRLGIE